MAGKGDNRRPSQVSAKEFDANWRRIFATPDDKVIAELNAKLERAVAKSQKGDPAARAPRNPLKGRRCQKCGSNAHDTAKHWEYAI